MENIYSPENTETCELVKAQKETVDFLLNFSKSLSVIEYEGIPLEGNLN
ncbi:MAG: hypothetical protein AAFZ89_11120 [Bacteroidota bacterium]